MPTVAAVKITPVWMAFVVPHYLEVGGHDKGRPQENRPLHVLRDHGQVRGAVAEQPGRQQGFLPGVLAAADQG